MEHMAQADKDNFVDQKYNITKKSELVLDV
jgi:hypothetical protein